MVRSSCSLGVGGGDGGAGRGRSGGDLTAWLPKTLVAPDADADADADLMPVPVIWAVRWFPADDNGLRSVFEEQALLCLKLCSFGGSCAPLGGTLETTL